MQFEGDAAEKSSELSTVREKLSALETRNRELMSELAEARRRSEQQSEAADDLKSRLAEERKAHEEAVRQSGNK